MQNYDICTFEIINVVDILIIIVLFSVISKIRSSGLGVVSWTCSVVVQCLYWGRGSIPTHSAAIPLGKGFTVHYLVFSDGT